MTTLSRGQAGVIAGGTSSFGQFRLTTFVHSTPKVSRASIASPVSRTTSTERNVEVPLRNVEKHSTVSSSRHLEPFSDALHSSPQSFAPPPPLPRANATPSNTAGTTSHNGFGVLDLTPPQALQGKLGPHRDGRVRNPVPLKLKGKTDEKKGNFAVMHMDMSGSVGGNDIPRSEAAQRTSENTAQAARTASKEGYTSLKRKRIDVPKNLQAVEHVAPSASFVSPSPAPPIAHRDRALTMEETKYEQARLLTLLRSINPITVVDQICKALAFFGGIPGAPPPADGVFPESADANGSGGLFVGWLSEIFPELERKSWKAEVLRPRELNRGSRPRGRPKGSKASKVRKDKGLKKGPKHSIKEDSRGLSALDLPLLRTTVGTSVDVNYLDEEWVDIGEVELQAEDTDDTRQRLPGTMNNRAGEVSKTAKSVPLINQTSLDLEVLDVGHGDQNNFQSYSTSSLDYAPGSTNSAKRRPGRPKGSRNRPKNSDQEDSSGASFMSPEAQHFRSASDSALPESQPHTILPSSSSMNRQAVASITVTQGSLISTQLSPLGPSKQRQIHTSKENMPVSSNIAPLSDLSPEEQAVLEAFRTAKAAQVANKPTKYHDKGKRGRYKNGVDAPIESPSAATTTLPNSAIDAIPVPNGRNATQISPTQQPAYKDSGPILPPPKRQRKGKDLGTTPAKRTSQTADSISTSTPNPTLKPTAISTEATLQPAMSNPKPPAQGLEAHYERFASLGQQGDQQKHQQQSQQQQALHDRNPVSRSSPMQSNTTYYQQSRHVPSPYEQQFPSQQTPHSYQGSLIPQNEPYRASNPQLTNFSSRQRPSATHFSHFTESSFMDVPALDPVTNGSANVGAYGQVPRSTSNAGFGSGAQMRNGFESISNNDLRDHLLRGMGRR